MTEVLLCGCNGRMGQTITRLSRDYDDIRVIAGVDITSGTNTDYPIYPSLTDVKENFDVIIDFSHPDNIERLLQYAASKGAAVVIATTGLSDVHKSIIRSVSEKIPVFYSANMSLGINVLLNFVKKVSPALESTFDIEIIEKHHNKKLDAPSGTALAIADAINSSLSTAHDYICDRHLKKEARRKNEIGISSVRGGTIVGEHTVIYAGNDEVIEITHSAASRDIFGHGAIKAAIFMDGKNPGFYNMDNLIDNN